MTPAARRFDNPAGYPPRRKFHTYLAGSTDVFIFRGLKMPGRVVFAFGTPLAFFLNDGSISQAVARYP
jgi:hypothetical protein